MPPTLKVCAFYNLLVSVLLSIPVRSEPWVSGFFVYFSICLADNGLTDAQNVVEKTITGRRIQCDRWYA